MSEDFDHSAAEIYATAGNLDLRREEHDRLLRLVRQQAASDRRPRPPVQQDPFNGRTALGTLALGDYAIFKILNGSDPKLTEPLSDLPPLDLSVHLAWLCPYGGIRAGSAPVLQAVGALVLDDWRAALQGFSHVVFFAHRERRVFRLGRPGPRWQTRLTEVLPPAAFVEAFFTRRRHTRADRTVALEPAASGFHAWFVLVLELVLEIDLPDLGLHRNVRSDMWWEDRPLRPLPRPWLHVVTVDPDSRTGDAYRQIGPHRFFLSSRCPARHGQDEHFCALRLKAMRALLDAIEGAAGL